MHIFINHFRNCCTFIFILDVFYTKSFQARPQNFTKYAEMTSIVPNSVSKCVQTAAPGHEEILLLFMSGDYFSVADILTAHL